MYKYKITVFTPTFNRGYIIGNLYKSLKKQTFKDFEWIIVDDGSTDNTEDLIKKYIAEKNCFDIIYKKVNNGGKHRAINEALNFASGELFFIVDSDDHLVEKSLERIVYWESTIENKKMYAGVAGNKGYSGKKMVGETFGGDYLDATSLERDKYNILGDKSEVFYTKLLKEYKFPEIEGEKFITERIVWDNIGYDQYKMRWFNEIIYICDYLEDGLSKSINNIFINNPKGYALDILSQIEFRKIKGKSKLALLASYYSAVTEKISGREAAKNLNQNYYRLLIVVFLWRLKHKFKEIFK